MKTRCELSVTARAPVCTFSAKTCTPTSIEHRPIASTWARRTAISPTLTGWRKSMSSMAPRRQWPRATRAAAMFPTVAIHCIMRPPWICPGAPACSGNTHWTISVTVSLIDGIGVTGKRSRFLVFLSCGPGQVHRAASPRRAPSGAQDDAVEPVESAGVQAQIPDFGAGHDPVQPDVERKPGRLFGEEALSSRVHPLALEAAGELTTPDEQIVEPRIPVEGQIPGQRALARALTGRQRVEEQVGIAAVHLRLCQRDLMLPVLGELERGLARKRGHSEVHAARCKRLAQSLRQPGAVHGRGQGRHRESHRDGT